MIPKVMNGARGLVMVKDRIVGLFHNVSYGVGYDTQDAYVLGRATCAEIGYTAVEPVSGTLTGWRVIGHGPHQEPSLPEIKDLLTSDYLMLGLIDRVTKQRFAKIQGVRIIGVNSALTVRQLTEMSLPFKGLIMSDENVDNAEAPGAADLP